MAEQLVRSLSLGEEGGEQLVMSFRMEGRLHKLAKRRRKAISLLRCGYLATEWVRVLVSARAPVSRLPTQRGVQPHSYYDKRRGTDSENELAPR